MITRSIIAARGPDGYRAVYCKFNGSPAINGRILLAHYRDAGKIGRLIDVGDVMVLRREIGEQHDFRIQADAHRNGWTTFYYRDAGRVLKHNAHRTRHCPDLPSLVDYALGLMAAYVYIYDRGWWVVKPPSRELSKLVPKMLDPK